MNQCRLEKKWSGYHQPDKAILRSHILEGSKLEIMGEQGFRELMGKTLTSY